MSDTRYIERPPRLQPELPQGEFDIPEPPQEEQVRSQPLIQVFLPVVTTLVYLVLSLSGGGRNPLLMIPMGISVVSSVGMALYSRIQGDKGRGQAQAAYRERLIELRKEMTRQHDLQRRFYEHSYPDPGDALRIAYEAHRHGLDVAHDERVATRLWERRARDLDFGALRLGKGTRPSTVVYTFSKGGGAENPLLRDVMRLAQDSRVLTGAPIGVPLAEDRSQGEKGVPSQHAIGVVGHPAGNVRAFASALAVHYGTFHAPTDARLFVLGLDDASEAWRWLEHLPHCSSEQPEDVLCFEDDVDRQEDKEQNKAARFLRRLRTVLEERRSRLRDEGEGAGVDRPLLLLVVDLLAPVPERSALADLESDPAISMIINEGPQLGAGVLFLVSELGKVPSGCRAVIELTAGRSGAVGFRFAEVGLNGARYAGTADMITNAQALEQFAAYLEPLRVRESYGADLPRGVLMQDMLGFTTADELRQQLAANWQRSVQPDQAEWLQVALGMLSGGDVRRLKFSADADGVHGLIAGSTGSGKSELLMTMILGLAYNYDPSIVNFVLVDFKGGAAFEPFRNLPHCVDIVTNLKGNAVERMFAAIMAEIHRREAINVATGSKHIVHYRQNGLHVPPYGSPATVKGETLETAPYPHLFVFIDEFAEMIAESPEYKAQLNSITRLGRALGITLILAAQRPTGVTDQMRANIKFRIALRVETREESSEVLRRPDAAYLPTGVPGRGYLQVGNEEIELIQVAWTGSDFRVGREEKAPDVIWHDRPREASAAEDGDLPKLFEVMVDAMADLAREHSLPQRKPWPDFLPESMSLHTPIDAHYLSPEGLNVLLGTEAVEPGDRETVGALVLNGALAHWLHGEGQWPGIDWEAKAMRAVVGLIDNPHHAEQTPLVVDLRRGHAAVFSSPGWGKTTFLRTLITSLAVTHSPRELHVYALDFGGRQMSVFRDLPHAGAIITPDEEERVTRLLRYLERQLEERKNLLSSARADELYSYNRSKLQDALPAILVVIDNFSEFRESYEHLMPALISLARESRAYGIHFAASAELPGSLSGKLYSLFTERFALKLADPTEYTGIVGRGARDIEDIPGRGFVKVGRWALAFQAALPVGTVDESAELDDAQRLGYLVRALREAAEGLDDTHAPRPIVTLTRRALLADLLSTAKAGFPARPVLGIEDRGLESWALDLRAQGPHCLVIGPPNSGKTTLLRSLTLSLAHTYSPRQVALVLVDYQRRFMHYGGAQTLSGLPHVVATVTDNDELMALTEALEARSKDLAEGAGSIWILIDNYDTFADEARAVRDALPRLATLARERGTDGLHFVIAGSPQATRSAEDLRKQLQMPRLGIALQSEDAVVALNGRVPRSLAQTELPMGRGFVVRAGRATMLQVATPYEDDERQAEILGRWVIEIQERYAGQTSERWDAERPSGVDEPAEAGEPMEVPPVKAASPRIEQDDRQDSGEEGESKGAALLRAVPEGVDIEALKRQLVEAGMDEDLLVLLSAVDIANVAHEMGILDLEGSDERVP